MVVNCDMFDGAFALGTIYPYWTVGGLKGLHP